MLEKHPARGEFHASIREVEAGLFRAQYSGEVNPVPADERDIPDFHLGTSLDEVKSWVEQMAVGIGYERVVWDELPSAASR